MKHLSREQIEGWVTGSDPGPDEAARQHLAACAECAGRLAREARLESDLHEVAAMSAVDSVVTGVRPVPGRTWRIVLPAAAALVVVVLVARLLLPRGGAQPTPPSVRAPRITGRTPESPCDLGGACIVPPEDVCRYATVERSRHLVF